VHCYLDGRRGSRRRPNRSLCLGGQPGARAGHPFVPAVEAEVRDTFELYAPARGMVCRSLTNEQFMSLPRATRSQLVREQFSRGRALVPSVRAWPSLRQEGIAEQADGHRFIWWSTLLRGRESEF
jgi:hypothetical protein